MPPDPCTTCGAAMAADQRYCLACGARRAEARLDFVEVLRGRERLVPAGPAPALPAAVRQQRASLAAVAGVGCLVLAMGVGVLIGRGGRSAAPAPVSAPAQVIKVEGGATGTASADATPSPSTPARRRARKRTRAAASKVPTARSAADSRATNPALTQLNKASGKDYSKQSQKLPKTLSTGGKAPPVDRSKPAGGGSGFQEIG